MADLLASRWARACANVRENWPAMLCGVFMALAVTPLLMKVSDTDTMNTVAAIAGDSLGFYGCIWIVARRKKFPTGDRRGWHTAAYMFKLYWLAEIIDNVLRAGILAWIASFTMPALATTLVGNLLADVVFFGIAALTGKDFSDWCVRVLRNMYALRCRFQTTGFVRFRLAAALVSVFLLCMTAIQSVEREPAASVVEAPRSSFMGPAARTNVAFVP